MIDAERLAAGIFRRYYRAAKVDPPPAIERREFGFVFFGSKSMVRHIAFNSPEELEDFLRAKYPRHVYYSSAYYERPGEDRMDDKGWLGADLIFDIDVDHIYTPCKEQHDRWVCRSCGAEGWGLVTRCTRCGSERISRQTWVCDTCIAVSRDELIKLVEFLEEDFGIAEDEMYAVFSGHRGFHLHVEKDALRGMGQDARREISDYVRGIGISPELFLEKRRQRYVLRYDVGDPGWPGRIARYAVYRYGVAGKPELRLSEWRKIFDDAVREERCEIDEKVTIDIKRLIRLPGSLHGKTGLRVLRIPLSRIEEIDVLREAIVAGDEEAIVRMEKPPRRVFWYTLDASKDKHRVPLHLALYLALNGGAVIERIVR